MKISFKIILLKLLDTKIIKYIRVSLKIVCRIVCYFNAEKNIQQILCFEKVAI